MNRLNISLSYKSAILLKRTLQKNIKFNKIFLESNKDKFSKKYIEMCERQIEEEEEELKFIKEEIKREIENNKDIIELNRMLQR